jgi:hypothetical protein
VPPAVPVTAFLIQRAGRQSKRLYAPSAPPGPVTPIVWAIGHWAAEWIFGDPAEEDCDGRSLMWRLHQHANPAKLPGSALS